MARTGRRHSGCRRRGRGRSTLHSDTPSSSPPPACISSGDEPPASPGWGSPSAGAGTLSCEGGAGSALGSAHRHLRSKLKNKK